MGGVTLGYTFKAIIIDLADFADNLAFLSTSLPPDVPVRFMNLARVLEHETGHAKEGMQLEFSEVGYEVNQVEDEIVNPIRDEIGISWHRATYGGRKDGKPGFYIGKDKFDDRGPDMSPQKNYRIKIFVPSSPKIEVKKKLTNEEIFL